MKLVYIRIGVIVLFTFFLSVPVPAQHTRELEFEGLIISSDLDNGISLGASLNYNYWFNPHIGLVVGGTVLHSNIDLNFDSPKDNLVSYYTDSQIVNLNGVVGLKLASRIYKRIGMIVDFKFMFEPIPFNYIEINKRTVEPNDNYPQEQSKNGMVFTKFNPSCMAELSLFHEFGTTKKRGRISLGGGMTNLNPYNAYYHSKVDGLWLKEYLKLRPNNLSFILFVRLTGGI